VQILDRNCRFAIEQSFFSHLGQGIKNKNKLSTGLVIAVLKSGGPGPEASEVLMMLVIVGRRTPRFSYSNFVGMGSR